MNIRTILAATGLAIAALGASSGATAQTYNGGDRHYDRDHRDDRRADRRDDRRDDRRGYDDRGRHYGWDRGRHYGWDRHHRNCWVEWRHHRRVTVCR